MLNKKICERCYEKQATLFEVNNESLDDWKNYLSENWEKGETCCIRYREKFGFVNINDNPPSWCPYKLEHIVCKDTK